MLLVSVIIATYNSSKTIARALDSVFAQKGLNEEFLFQVIVVDDCSKDNTVEIVQKYSVQLFQNLENSGGPNKGRNIALQHSKGDYIAFIDHDDEWLDSKIISQLKAINDEKVATSGYIDFDTNTNTKRVIQTKSTQSIIRYPVNHTFLKKLSRSKKSQKTYFGSIMIHHSLKKMLFEEKHGMVDYDWVLSIFENQKSVEVTQPLFIRYVEQSNLSLNEKYRLNDLEISKTKIITYARQYPIESQIGLKRLNSSMGRYYYLVGDLPKARSYFLNGKISLVAILYFLTTFIGRKYVIKKVKVFG